MLPMCPTCTPHAELCGIFRPGSLSTFIASGMEGHKHKRCIMGYHLMAWGCGQDFVGTTDASADPDLRVMAEAVLGALQE